MREDDDPLPVTSMSALKAQALHDTVPPFIDGPHAACPAAQLHSIAACPACPAAQLHSIVPAPAARHFRATSRRMNKYLARSA